MINARPLSRRPWSLYLLALLFVGAGLLHFLKPETYLRIMPPALPAPRLLVLLSGVAEVAGGLGLLLPATRRWAAWGLLALLLAVFPANVYMLQIQAQLHIPAWVAWARLPLQPLLMWGVWHAAKPASR
ncbi:DoxX family membrane protein [Hymenobacter sp. HMF4947]|uniref:DoxX family membrane protein n=1 Tax=Hymenobacter ginkgonis TaxID=2682976 RepID=A0A7K1TCE5_9BACT|nr:DoxX family protein [Hymenobacter ginkgonis]MVN76043.1 DoxX family membrane protein [Hymenobacter ginkgonis]